MDGDEEFALVLAEVLLEDKTSAVKMVCMDAPGN